MKRIAHDTTIRARSGVFATTVDDELIVFDPNSGKYFGAGVIGARIWHLVSERKQISQICDALLEEFDVDISTCETDVIEFLSELNAAGLIDTE